MADLLNIAPVEYWTPERQQKLSRAYGTRRYSFQLILDKFHPNDNAKQVLLQAYEEGKAWSRARKRSLLSTLLRAS